MNGKIIKSIKRVKLNYIRVPRGGQLSFVHVIVFFLQGRRVEIDVEIDVETRRLSSCRDQRMSRRYDRHPAVKMSCTVQEEENHNLEQDLEEENDNVDNDFYVFVH